MTFCTRPGRPDCAGSWQSIGVFVATATTSQAILGKPSLNDGALRNHLSMLFDNRGAGIRGVGGVFLARNQN